jgi:hypothetical protein
MKKATVKYCPKCHSENIAKQRKPSIAVVLAFFIFKAPFPFFKNLYFCFDCRHEWKPQNNKNQKTNNK